MTSTLRTTTLANKITVATERLDHVETASFGVYVHTGSRNETYEENGLAHFLEHMAFKGTSSRSAQQIAEEIENVGGLINACTSREQTIFYVKLLKEHLSLGISILGDIMCDSVFDPCEIERERGVILQEIAQSYDTPDDIIFDYYQQACFPDQALGRPILGSRAHVQHFTRDELIKFKQARYAPDKIVIAAAGALDHDDVVAQVETQFSHLAASPQNFSQKAQYQGGDVRIHKPLDQAHMILGFDAMSYLDEHYYAALLLSMLLGGGMSSRLFQEIREKRGLVYSIFSGLSGFQDSGLFTIYAATGPDECTSIMPPLIHELHKVQEHITQDELTRSKAQLKAALLMSLESTDSRCDRIARHLQFFGRSIPLKETISRIENVTVEDVRMMARKIFSTPSTFTALGAIEKLPSKQDIQEAFVR